MPLSAVPSSKGLSSKRCPGVVLGGIGNIRGSVIAAVVLTLLPELLRGLNDYRMLIYSIVLIVMMLYNWAPNMIAFRKKMANRVSKKKEVA